MAVVIIGLQAVAERRNINCQFNLVFLTCMPFQNFTNEKRGTQFIALAALLAFEALWLLVCPMTAYGLSVHLS